MNLTASDWIAQLGLQPHPEGGWYKEVHRSPLSVHGGTRTACTSIYFLLEYPQVSCLHRLDAEELWYWHAGHPLHIQVVDPTGQWVTHTLGPEGSLQTAVAPGCWFGAELAQPGTWALVGCAVAPAFEFSGFEMAQKEGFLKDFPHLAHLAHRLISSGG